MKRVTRILLCVLFSSILITPVSNAASETALLTICTSLKSGYQLISKTGKCNERIYEARTWFQKGSALYGTPGSTILDMRTCIRKSSKVQIIGTRAACNSKIYTTALWQRPLGPPVAPSITSVAMGLLGTATLNIAAPTVDGGVKVTSYLVTSTPGQVTATYTPAQIKAAKITGLTPGSSYSFSVVAINIKGPSPSSIASASTLAPTIPSAPSITKVSATGTNSAQISFSPPLDSGGLPITSYVATSNPGSLQTTVYQSAGGTINMTNLSHSTTYTFTLMAINTAGSSLPSVISAPITTATPPPPEPVAPASSIPALAAPAFTLSSSSETKTVNTAATGFTISSTGGAIASFAISATPAGMSFSTSTGALTGTPTSVAGATAYTVTATNASGSTTQTFTLTVTATLAAPAFTLSSSSETRTVNTAATGFTISSTGGAIASFAISATPAGMSFSTSTGALTGTPTSVAGATAYTVTATNASGSTTQTFTLTVTAAPIVISVAAIAGVTAPVTGATPVSTTTAGTGYTGTVSWSGSPATFASVTTYTATITLTPTSGYTLTGVSANFFSVTGATSVTHSADAGVITAVFPATAAGAAAGAAITTQPTGAASGSTLGIQPVIRIVDASGNTVTSSSVSVVASIASGTGTLSGTTTVTASSGIATFTNLVITGTAGNFTLTFTPTSLTPITSSSLAITVGPATKVAITRASVGTSPGVAFTTQPQITIQDSSGNTITSSTAVVTATVSAGGTLVGTLTATASSGVATFSTLGIRGFGGTAYTIAYTASGLTTATQSVTPSALIVGNTGPGGGKIYYVAGSAGFTCGPTLNETCYYLEAAPGTTVPESEWNENDSSTWNPGAYLWSAVFYEWSGNYTEYVAGIRGRNAIGTGYANTLAMIAQSNTPNMAGTISQAYRGNGLSDWYLPSLDESSQFLNSTQYPFRQYVEAGGFWVSTEVDWCSFSGNCYFMMPDYASTLWGGDYVSISITNKKFITGWEWGALVWPVRSF